MKLAIKCWVQDLTPFWNAIRTSRSLRNSTCLTLEEEHGLDGGLSFSSGEIRFILKTNSWPCCKIGSSILWIWFLHNFFFFFYWKRHKDILIEKEVQQEGWEILLPKTTKLQENTQKTNELSIKDQSLWSTHR